MLQQLNDLDTRLFLFLNGMHNSFFDFVMYWASDRFIWIPFYGLIAYLLIKKFKTRFILMGLFIALLIVLSDQVSSHVIKTFVARLRPCHNPVIAGKVHLLFDHCGGQFGFVSSHASSSFAFATMVALLAKDVLPRLKYIMFTYAILVSYSRIYLGVHYPGDILGGAILGSTMAFLLYSIYSICDKKLMNNNP